MKPCPSCGAGEEFQGMTMLVFNGSIHNEGLRCEVKVKCLRCGVTGPLAADEEMAADLWDAMPRGIEWHRWPEVSPPSPGPNYGEWRWVEYIVARRDRSVDIGRYVDNRGPAYWVDDDGFVISGVVAWAEMPKAPEWASGEEDDE
jgi:hypothetical protein